MVNRAFMANALLAVAGLVALGIGDVHAAPAGKKVTLCHVPPGNPADAHTITVGESAVSAHLAHGDELGECPTGCRLNASLCDDANACTSDSCENGECAHEPVNCDDGNSCTTDGCDEATGCSSAPIPDCCRTDGECDDDVPCTVDACDDGSCSNTPPDCSVENQCLAGFCDASGACDTTEVDCADADFCTDDGCHPASGCFHVQTASPPETTEVTCDDGLDNDCDGGADAADSDCAVAACGNGDIDPGEECDSNLLPDPDPACDAVCVPGSCGCLPPGHENACLCVAVNDV